MYSVLIQNQRTIEEFTEFHPLFLEALNKNQIGVCRWNESGTTIDTALPDLAYLTDDKDEWRAIVVCLEGDGTGGEKTDNRNPFDFSVNKPVSEQTEDPNNDFQGKDFVSVKESRVPIVRLTQMLGGVPEPEIKFVPQKIEEDEKANKVVFNPVWNEDDNAEYERLCRKYKFDGKLPSSVIVVTIRKDFNDDSVTRKTWRINREFESSDFCRRNRYPDNCRFLVYDYKVLGANQLECDRFRFWTAILILALNKIDPSTLQAYRLYNLDIVLNKNSLEDNFTDSIRRLKAVMGMINREIRREKEKNLDVDPSLPDFEIAVDVPVEQVSSEKICVKPKVFGIFGSGALSEIRKWTQSKNRAISDFEKVIKSAERTLNIKADQMRSSCHCTEEDVIGLDYFQREDLTEKVYQLYNSIIDIQNNLPEKMSENDKMESRSTAVKKYLSKRFELKPALIFILVTSILVILGFSTAFLNKSIEINSAVILTLLKPAVCATGLAAIASLFVAVFQKLKLNSLIDDFNNLIYNSISRLNASAGIYSDYLSAVASHTRGYTYLIESEKMDYYEESGRAKKLKHIRSISAMITKIKIWAKAFNIKDVDVSEIEEYVEVNLEEKPAENSLYTFDYDEDYPVMLNNSGKTVSSPFSFVQKIKIEREELYQDE